MPGPIQPTPWMVTPFVVLLAGIALAPLCFSSWWGKHYGKVSLILASIVIGYYWFGLGAEERLLQTAEEYFSFICLIGSLFVISGGIHLSVLGEATPGANVSVPGSSAISRIWS